MPKEVSPGAREMAQSRALRPQRASRSKILPFPLTVKQTEAQRGEEACSRSPSQLVAKLVIASPGLVAYWGPRHYLQSSHLQPRLLGAAVPTCQRGAKPLPMSHS